MSTSTKTPTKTVAKKKRKLATFPAAPKFQMDSATLLPTDKIMSFESEAVSKKSAGTTAQDLILYFIFLFGFLSLIGSLYFSTYGDPVKNIMLGQFFPTDGGFPPCELCWFARILMYPIAIISLVGLIKDDKHFTDYVLPLSVIGVGLEIFHYGLQKWNFPNPFRCTTAVPCSALQVQYFGFVTIPLLALIGFSFVTVLCVINWQLNRRAKLTN